MPGPLQPSLSDIEGSSERAQLVGIGLETTRGSSALPGTKLEPSKTQIEYQGLVTSEVEKIKSAVQCSHLWVRPAAQPGCLFSWP